MENRQQATQGIAPAMQQPWQKQQQEHQQRQPHSLGSLCAAPSMLRSGINSSGGSNSGSSGSSSDSSNDESDDCQEEIAASSSRQWRGGSQPSEAPNYDAAQLALSLGLPSSTIQQGVAKLSHKRYQELLENGSQVAAHLRSLGLRQQQLEQLVVRCPELFSWPAKERAAVLFGQLQQLGLTAAEAGKCFQQQPEAVSTPSYQSAIDVLAALYEAAGSKGGESGEQRVGRLLRGQPTAVDLLKLTAGTLQKRIANLQRLGLSSAQIVACSRQSWTLLKSSPERLAKRQQLLHDELGVSPELFAKILYSAPRVVTSSDATLVSRCRALVAVFGKEAVRRNVGSSPGLLGISSSVWQAALEVMRLVGVPDPVAVAQGSGRMLTYDWLDLRRLVNRLAVQRCLGLTPSAVYQQYAGYVSGYNPQRLAGRLLYLEQCGLLPLVEDKGARLRAWRLEHGMPANRKAPGEPAIISLCDVCILTDAGFLSLLSKNGCDSGYAAFQAGLEALPAWQQLWAAAEVEGARLRAALPDELRKRLAAGDKEETAEDGDK